MKRSQDLIAAAAVLAFLGHAALAQEAAPDPQQEAETFVRDLLPPVIVSIGAVQGPVHEQDRGASHLSSRDGKRVTIQGVVHHPMLRAGRRGDPEWGFFLQNTRKTADDDPDTSDGIFVHLQARTTVRMQGTDERYTPKPGDEIVLSGTVREFCNLTQLASPAVRKVVRRGLDLDEAIPAVEARPPDRARDADRYWERLEGMRCRIPAGAISQQGRRVNDATSESYAVFLHPDHPVAQRANPAHRRVFRDAHPLDNQPDLLFDDENAFLIEVGSLALQGAASRLGEWLAPVRTFDVLTEPVTGAVYQFFDTYSIQPAHPLQVASGVDPFASVTPPVPPEGPALRVATFNLENLYDDRNDPSGCCDAAADPGNEWVQPPFDYVPASAGAYAARLRRLAAQIVQGMGAPDLLLLQEVENQDLLTFEDQAEPRDGPDGRLDTLQDLALAVRELGGPVYEIAANRNGADLRGIVCGFLFNPARLSLATPAADHALLGEGFRFHYAGKDAPMNREVANPKAFNAEIPESLPMDDELYSTNVFSRAVQLALFKVHAADGGQGPLLYALCNHFSSRPNRRVSQRQEQAALNGLLASRILKNEPGAWILLGGDLNTFPRPDEPSSRYPSDQLAPLYNAGLENLYDALLAERPAGAYTHVHRGQAGTIDQLFVSPALGAQRAAVWVPHLNTDWPDQPEGEAMFGASDHDPVVAIFRVPGAAPAP